MTNASAAPATPAAPPTLALLGVAAEATVNRVLARFQESVQEWLDSPLDAARVHEWARLRSAAGPAAS